MQRMISIIDLRNGEVQERPSDTLTLDVPADFDRPAGSQRSSSPRLYRLIAIDPRNS